MSAIAKWSSVVASGVLAVVAVVGGASAEGRDMRLHGNFVMVFDSSGSMVGATAEPTSPPSKTSVAKTFARSLFAQQQGRSDIEGALIVIGANFDSDQPGSKTAGCRDVAIKVGRRPMNAATVAAATEAITAAKARGYTPLGLAVREAIDLLGPAGGSIVVVTDLEETCEDGTHEHACEVMAVANANRMPANRVYFDSIIVTRSAKMSMDAVKALGECTHAPIVEVTNDRQALEAATVVATRLGDLADQGDGLKTPVAAGPKVAVALTVIDGLAGGGRVGGTVVLSNRPAQVEHRVTLAAGKAEVTMAPGAYEVATIDENGRVTRAGVVEITAETAEVTVSLGTR